MLLYICIFMRGTAKFIVEEWLVLKGNRQIGLDGRIFISDCLSDGIFFVYSIILSGILGAVGDILKLIGKSSYAMDSLTNGLIIMDLACCLGLVMVSYYVYFMNCGENMPQLGVKPLIYLEYVRLAYYGMLIYDVLYRFSDEILHSGKYPFAMSVFYVFYLGWLIACAFAAMFILTVLNQNMIRRSYSDSFKMLALTGLAINIAMPLVFFITKIWVKGAGDGFYSSGLCDFIRLGIAPIFYAALWFLFLNAIDQVDRVFSEVDNAIRDKNYRIEFEEENNKKSGKKPGKKSGKASDKKSDKQADKGVKKAKSKKKSSSAEDISDKSDTANNTEHDDTDSASGVSPEIAFETAYDASPEPSVDEGVTDDVGGMVDINAFFEQKSADEQQESVQPDSESETVSEGIPGDVNAEDKQ